LSTAIPDLGGPKPQRVAIIGGGITGLAAAHRLLELHPQAQVVLYEAADRIGGVLKTELRDGYLIEHAADMFITEPSWAVDLCRRIGLADELIATNDRHRQAFVVCRSRLEPVPEGFTLLQPGRARPILKSPLLSWRGKLRLGMEYFVPRRRAHKDANPTSQKTNANSASSTTTIDDESLASFARRRLGREAYERLVQPLVSGIYTADPERLSLAATLPRFLEMEQEYRSLIRAAWEQRKARPRMKAAPRKREEAGIRYGVFMAPRRGMQSLVDALATRLTAGDIRLRTAVTRVQRSPDGRWQVITAGTTPPESFDALIVAAPAPIAAELLANVDRELTRELRHIEYAGSAVVCTAYPRSQIEHRLDGFGFVVPAVERRRIIATSFASVKFAGRAPDERVLFRVFIGGALQPELLKLSDDQLLRLVHDELVELLGARGQPDFAIVARWSGVMPQYHVGHLDRVARIESRVEKLPGLQLAGNAYHGVGIPHCIHSGERAVEQLF
jgi:protoporphyrinogen/coproporphyrinogen III oxidase